MTVLSLSVIGYTSKHIAGEIESLSEPRQVDSCLVGSVSRRLLFAAPSLKWARMKCPRCGNKFVHGQVEFGILFSLPLLGLALGLGWGAVRLQTSVCGC